MQSLPHRYNVEASAKLEGPVSIASEGLETFSTAPPVQYGGPGGQWSPETLLIAAVVDCFVLTFRAIARASSLQWVALRCDCEGELDRVERTTRFTAITLRAHLSIPAGGAAEKAGQLLEKAERACLVTNSLACAVKLEPHVSKE
jgi:organic hydroperoxide reductase OsmC/OhrA